MNLTSHTALAVLPLLCSAGVRGAGADPAPERRPNVLFILTDDQGWGDVRAHGNPLINTPTLDGLYAQSVVMDRFFTCPLSAPTRASILTGRYHLRTGVSNVQSGLENMNPDETTLAELFRDAGYVTGCFGKWHNGTYFPYTPNGQGFSEFLGFCCGHWANYFDPMLQHNETVFRGKGYITDIFTDAALGFIDENKDRPFFCYVPYNAPHSPFQVPDEYYDKYKDLPGATERDRKTLASVYAMVECVDANIARLLGRLDSLGLRENTIVIFMSDNGPVHVVRYNGDMRGQKGSVHEGGVRVPCYISWPGQLTHHVYTEPAAHVDLLPTLMELCGIRDYRTAFPVDGISLAKAIRGEEPVPTRRMIFTHRMQQELGPWLGGVRTDDYRMALYPGEVMLFNMKNDPSETTNIYDGNDPGHKSLYEAYMKWYEEASKGVRLVTDVPVGYPEAPQVRIPTPEGKMYGALKCYGYPNQNWVNHFQNPGDSLCFTLGVVRAGEYEIVLEYNHEGVNTASRAVALCGGKRLSAPVPEFCSELTYQPDRVKRDEAYEKTWGQLSLGKVHLNKGLHKLTVHAEGVAGPDRMQVKTIIINRK